MKKPGIFLQHQERLLVHHFIDLNGLREMEGGEGDGLGWLGLDWIGCIYYSHPKTKIQGSLFLSGKERRALEGGSSGGSIKGASRK